MTKLANMSPNEVAQGLGAGTLTLIDIRENDEYRREHIEKALHIPLSALEKSNMEIEAGRTVVYHCRSGQRTELNCGRLAEHVDGEAFIMQGGLNAWKAAGLPTTLDAAAPIEINRQVQITAGLLILASVLLGYFVYSGFYGLAGFVGAGLMFAGITGSCGMAKVLMEMPWNRRAR